MTGLSHKGARLKFSKLRAETFEERPHRVVLPNGEVHVWAFCLVASPEVSRHCKQWLSRAERDRAGRFRFEHDRDHYVVAHGYLRYLLGRYCGEKPDALKLDLTSGGKPIIYRAEGQHSPVSFNLTHSHDYGVIAVAGGKTVGVDLEQVREDVEHLKLAERFFSPAEWQAIRVTKGEDQRAAFFRHWVAKEAILKAKGTGLTFPLDRCELVFGKEEDVVSVRWNDQPIQETQWAARYLPLESGWVGAVAAEGTNWMLTLCEG